MITIPKGSRIIIPEETKKELEAIAVNEIKDGAFSDDVILVSKSYIIERDEREFNLLKIIADLKVK